MHHAIAWDLISFVILHLINNGFFIFWVKTENYVNSGKITNCEVTSFTKIKISFTIKLLVTKMKKSFISILTISR